jgi:hypothetical protein
MAVITIPTLNAASLEMSLVRADSALEFISGAEVIVQAQKAVWAVSFPLRPMKKEIARPWKAALSQLSKLANTFQITPPDYEGPSNGYLGTQPKVKGASQLGLTLVCDVVSTASTTIGLVGDYFTVNGEFKILTANAITASGGSPNQVTLEFEPALRKAPADNALVEMINPLLTLRLFQSVGAWATTPAAFYSITVNAVESFGP